MAKKIVKKKYTIQIFAQFGSIWQEQLYMDMLRLFTEGLRTTTIRSHSRNNISPALVISEDCPTLKLPKV